MNSGISIVGSEASKSVAAFGSRGSKSLASLDLVLFKIVKAKAAEHVAGQIEVVSLRQNILVMPPMPLARRLALVGI